MVDCPNIPGMMRLFYLGPPLCPSPKRPRLTHRFSRGAIHEAHLSYYKDFPIRYNLLGKPVDDSGRTYPDLTSGFVFNPRRSIKLIQGTHPVVYVGAGSHASFPVGGKVRIYDKDVEFGGRRLGIEVHESMSHTGLVLSTLADESHSGRGKVMILWYYLNPIQQIPATWG